MKAHEAKELTEQYNPAEEVAELRKMLNGRIKVVARKGKTMILIGLEMPSLERLPDEMRNLLIQGLREDGYFVDDGLYQVSWED